MTVKHTPGPWLFRGKSSSVHEQPKNEPGENYTYGKQIFRFRDDDDEVAGISDEDLALILAAPDLLDALEEYHRVANAVPYAQWTPAMHKAQGAIAKAKGEKRGKPSLAMSLCTLKVSPCTTSSRPDSIL